MSFSLFKKNWFHLVVVTFLLYKGGIGYLARHLQAQQYGIPNLPDNYILEFSIFFVSAVIMAPLIEEFMFRTWLNFRLNKFTLSSFVLFLGFPLISSISILSGYSRPVDQIIDWLLDNYTSFFVKNTWVFDWVVNQSTLFLHLFHLIVGTILVYLFGKIKKLNSLVPRVSGVNKVHKISLVCLSSIVFVLWHYTEISWKPTAFRIGLFNLIMFTILVTYSRIKYSLKYAVIIHFVYNLIAFINLLVYYWL